MTDTTHDHDSMAPQVEPGTLKKIGKFIRTKAVVIYIIAVPIVTYNAGYNLRFGDWLGWQVLTLCGLVSLFGWMLLKQHSNALLEKAARKRYIFGLTAVALLFAAVLGYRLMGINISSLSMPDFDGGLMSFVIGAVIATICVVGGYITLALFNDWRDQRYQHSHNNQR